jgi:flagellar motility protein MotE (MotC chaperone)
MMKHIRILPVTVVALVLIFGLKLSAVWTDAQGVLFDVDVATAQASDQTAEEPKAETVTTNADTEEEKSAKEGAPADATVQETTVASADPNGTQQFSKSEIEVLERLVDRRAELDRRGEELDMRDNLLQATESRIDEKINKLKEMQATLQSLLQTYDEQEKAQMESLVKIYEKMKPKDAARIFNDLEMEILIDVASNIKEAKMAAILAAMNSKRANMLTVELATRRQLPGESDDKS